jgi:CheY-like chemotaxis protein
MKKPNTNKTILVIDSNKIHRLLLENILKRTNYNLVFATNEKEIYYYCHSIMNFDLVLIELYLCGTDGFNLIKLIKKINKEIPVIALTVCASKKEREKCFKSGCDVFISKPFAAVNLIKILEQTLKN